MIPEGPERHRSMTRLDFLKTSAKGGGVLLSAGAMTDILAACGSGGSKQAVSSASLKWAIDGDPESMDYLEQYDYESLPMSSVYLESLIRQREDGLEPYLAGAFRIVSGTQFEFDIRKDVLFHDGSRMTPDDVVFSLKRNLDPALGSFMAWMFQDVADIKADVNTVIVTLKRPNPIWPDVAGSGGGKVSSRAFIEKHGKKVGSPAVGLIGTGQYQFVSWRKGRSITFRKFEHYWDKTSPPTFGQLVFNILPDANSVSAGLSNGQIEGSVIQAYQQVPVLKKTDRVDVVTADGATAPFAALLNCARPPFDNPRVRRALSLVMDRPGYIKSALFGNGDLPAGPVTPPLWASGETRAIWKQSSARLRAKTDLQKAKELLAGQGKTKASILVVEGQEALRAGALALASGARKIGADISVDVVPPAQFYGAINGKGRHYDAISYYPGSDFYQSYGILTFFESKNRVTGSSNYANFSDAQIDELIARGTRLPRNSPEQARIFAKAQERIMTLSPWVLYANPHVVLFRNAGLTGYKVSPNYIYDYFVRRLRPV